jgi:polar amino acid transport system substrate-binding protein
MLNRREFAGGLAAAAAVRRRGQDRTRPAAEPPPAKEPNLARVLRTKKLRLAMFTDDEPYSFKRGPDGQWAGFFIAMARDLASELGVEVAGIETNLADVAADLNAGKLDLTYAPSPTAPRAMFADFADPLFYDTYAIIARKGLAAKSWAEINTPERLVAAETGSPCEEAARRFAGNAAITGFKSREEAQQAVQSGRADCLVAPVFHALAVLKKDPQLGELVVPTPQLRVPVCPAMPYDDDRRLHGVLNAWGEDKRATSQVGGWIISGLAELGIGPGDLPPDVSF